MTSECPHSAAIPTHTRRVPAMPVTLIAHPLSSLIHGDTAQHNFSFTELSVTEASLSGRLQWLWLWQWQWQCSALGKEERLNE
ncbi:hypothetical protein E2C01_047417 [Portunus trituberculatus]|uniref:Uncharacterized protein n=1 Tax=Portunus trituberculatus TaxID=210409 RepID=A0A5B7G3I4_PORTR|nr:hypothetical protein [Portunus trituberculatus]